VDLTEFDALSFDCYGTLIDWESGILAVLGLWASRRGLTVGDEQLLAAFARHESQAEREHPTELYPAILARTFRGVGEELSADVSDADAAALGRSVPDWPAFDDSRETLRRLSERYKLIILSNVDRDSFAASNAKLGVEFTSIISAQDVGSYKPSPRNFEALTAEAARLGVAPGRLLHVAQSLFHDPVPAQQIGLRSVWINRRHDRPEGGATLAPATEVSPDAEFPSMAAFAAAATGLAATGLASG
jgi:2-haloacid dehalogenase